MKKYAWILFFLVTAIVMDRFLLSDHVHPSPTAVEPTTRKAEPKPAIPPERNIPSPPQYHHRLTYDPSTDTLQGETGILVWNQASSPTRQVWFHLYLHAFDQGQTPPVLPQFRKKAYPKGIQHGRMDLSLLKVNGQTVASTREGSILKVDLNEEWSPNTRLEIKLGWKAKIPEIAHRFGKDEQAVWFGNILPILAVYDDQWHGNQYEAVGDPFFTEAADFTVEIKTPLDYQVTATGEESEEIREHHKWTRVHSAKVRDFTFAISRSHQVVTAQTSTGKTVNLYFRKAKVKQVQANLKQAVDMMNFMERQVGPYPYGELDVFENEMFVTGMEYPGLVFVRSDRLNEPRGYETVVHEIAHQWFYNLVGNNPLEEPWLDEGFATYFQDEFVYGNQLEKYYVGEQQAITQRFPQTHMGPVYQYRDWSSYWRGNYRKASLMILALKQKIGEEPFQRMVQEYISVYRNQIATGKGLMILAQKHSRADLTPFFKEWGILK